MTKKYCLLPCDPETHKAVKIKAANSGKTISGLLKDTFGKSSEEELGIGSKKKQWKMF